MLTVTEKLLHTTVRIQCRNAKGELSSGTGFYFSFRRDNAIFPCIVTNKHVVDGQVSGSFNMTMVASNGGPDYGKHELVDASDFAQAWIGHPDPNVDLAICPIGMLINNLAAMGKRPFMASIEKSVIPDATALEGLDAVEDIMMVGYPNGLWDSKNNTPIMRRGITATHPFHDYNGKPEFMIDAACFPGSSGSPVFIVNQGWVREKGRGLIGGADRLLFLGVLHSGPIFTATGKIEIRTVPTSAQPVPVVDTMMNLGICVKSAKVLDFEAVLEKKGVLPPATKLLAAGEVAA